MSGYETLSANSQNIKKFQLQQKARSFLVIFAIGIPVFLAMLAYLYYQDAVSDNKPTSLMEESVTSPDAISSDSTNPNQGINGTNASSVAIPSGTSTPGQTSPSQPVSSSGVPDGVQTALNSVEANGIKGNPYVTFDTSTVPDGASVKADRSTWTATSETQGTVNGTISAYGQIRDGTLTFTMTDGVWRITGYAVTS